jgi:hypothetical protein
MIFTGISSQFAKEHQILTENLQNEQEKKVTEVLTKIKRKLKLKMVAKVSPAVHESEARKEGWMAWKGR